MVAQLKAGAFLILGVVCLIWAVEAVNVLSGRQLTSLGVLPRHLSGLIGIPLSPFVHGSTSHATVNTVPFLVLGGLVALRGVKAFVSVSGFVILCGGTALWLFGRASYHIGASGLIFGYFGYLVACGWYERSTGAILTALLTLFLYGGLVWGVLPSRSFISWEGHLFGMLSGILAARLQGSQE
jgi:membrane associated rhomboid family serine protease